MSGRVGDEFQMKEIGGDISSAPSSRRHHSGRFPYIHKLGKPPKQNLLKEISTAVKETFFSDDPFRSFKDQPKSKKFMLGVQAVFPIFDWARDYSLAKFKGDLIAGLTIASLCIPQACLLYNYYFFKSYFNILNTTFGFNLRSMHVGKRNKKYFWVPAVAPMVSVVVSTFCVYITRADKDGVQIVNHIEKGINPASANDLFLSGEHVGKAFRIGVVAGIIALTEAIAIGRTFAAMKSYQIDGNKEMVALGTMNIIGSLTSCYVATGSFSRSAVNYMSGCHTAVSNIVMAGVVFLTLELITPLFKYTPNAILASIIIAAVVNLLDYEAAILIWKIDKFDFVACMGAFFGVVFISVEIGLLIAVSLSLAKILLQVTRPRTAVLGKLPRTSVYRNTLQYPEARQVPGVLIIRVDSAIYFTNSNYIKERILRWLTEEEERVDECHLPKIQHLIVEMSPVTDIDTSGIHALEELYKNLQKREIQLALANPGTIVMDKLYQSEFADEIGESNIFLSVGDAIHTFAPKTSITEEP
ncbi:hypothetical protein CsatA_025683 [Cannabis sativa]